MRAALLAVALLLVVAPARSEDPHAPAPPSQEDGNKGAPVPPPAAPAPAPPSGLLFLLAGGGLTAAGAIDLGTAPLCRLSAIRSTAQPACIGTSVAFGVALLGAGVPLLVLGARQRAAWKTWKLDVGPTVGGAAMTWEATW